MKANLENTTVRDLAYLIQSTCLKAPANTPLERLAEIICSSDHYKVYLEDEEGRLVGIVQAKQIASKVLELSRHQSDEADLLPAIAFALNAQTGQDLADPPVTVTGATKLGRVLELMHQNHIREIAVVDDEGQLVGIIEAKHILSHYLQAKTESNL